MFPLKQAKFTLHRKSFLKDLLKQGKEKERESMTIVNEIRKDGYIT